MFWILVCWHVKNNISIELMASLVKKVFEVDKLVESPLNQDPIILIQQFFVHKDPERYEELKLCLRKNVDNKCIDKIILLNEQIYTDDELGIISEKIVQVNMGERLTYKYAFKYAINNFSHSYVALANSDIFFDQTLENVRRSCLSTEPSVYALLRYEYSSSVSLEQCKLFCYRGGPVRWDSQDTWIFHTDSLVNIIKVLNSSNFSLGRPGCDNRIAHVLNDAGNKCYNAVKNVRTYHVHKNLTRSYGFKDVIPPPHLHLLPDSYAK